MKAIVGAALITAVLVSWAPNAHASTTADAQPLTRVDCDAAGLAWDDNGNVCDWQATKAELAPIQEITAAIPSGQPLTRVDCDAAGLAWDDNGNVCDWQATKAELAPIQEITAAIPSGQPLTRVDCDAAGLAWDDNGNVCDWTNRRT
jgi:hypothetical protein